MRAGLALLLLVLAVVPPRVAAQRFARDWGQLSPEEQRRAWENYQRYRDMAPSRRDTYEQRYQRFQKLPPQEQRRLRQNYDAYRGQNPAAREQFNRKYRRWKERGGQ